MRRICAMVLTILGAGPASAAPQAIRCDDLSTEDLAVDGVLDDWQGKPAARIGTSPEGTIELRCSWDGSALAVALRFDDERIVRVRSGKADEDRVELELAAGGKPIVASIKPGNAMAKAVIAKPPRSAVADSLQPKGFQIEARFPAASIPGFSASSPSLSLIVAFHDSDRATGGDAVDLVLDGAIELGDRKDLLDDFLKATKLKKSDLRVDQIVDVDPDRKGKERVVAGGTVIGVLTDKFGYVTLPAARPADVLGVELLPLGNRGQAIIAARVKQSGNGGTRELLMLWTVWSGQLEPLASDDDEPSDRDQETTRSERARGDVEDREGSQGPRALARTETGDRLHAGDLERGAGEGRRFDRVAVGQARRHRVLPRGEAARDLATRSSEASQMIGSTVGNYRIEAELGRGGMGVVYRAAHVGLGRPAALKMLLPQFSADPTIVQRFFNEAKTASGIRHPGIVEIYEAEKHTDGSAYIAMALLAGQSLEDRLRHDHHLAISDAIQIAYQVAGALAAAHGAHVVHRDLKPDNIFLVPDDDMPGGVRTKLLDFGIAKLVGAEALKLTAAGMMMGTPLYMSPEQCRGADEVDHRTDLYALGCVMFHMLCGRPPFTATSITGMINAHLGEQPVAPSSIDARIPAALDALVLTLLHKDRDARIQSATDVRTALKQVGTPAQFVSREPAETPSELRRVAANQPTVMTESESAPGQFAGPAPTIDRPKRWRWLIAGAVGAIGVTAAIVIPQLGGSSPDPIVGTPDIAVGSDHSCALRADGSVRCWGNPEFGRTQPPALTFVAISAAGAHTCGLRPNQTIVCWGADTTRLDGAFRQLSVGESHTCAVTSDQRIRCHGSNLDNKATPPAGTYRFVSTGPRETCAIRTDGSLTCWGLKSSDQLPVGSFTQLALGRGFGCALDEAHALACFGVIRRAPQGRFTSVRAAEGHACALGDDQSIHCFGAVLAPPPAGRFVALAVGPQHGCALSVTGAIACWGDNTDHQASPPGIE